MSDSFEPLRRLFSDAGYGFVDPPLLYDANVFVELAGEDLRRRLYLTAAIDGTEMALRPDFTIPICLHHLATGASRRRADYAYLGPVFRQRKDESGEFLQAGVESLGRNDRAAADADMLALALAAVRLLKVKSPTTRIGDSALFAAVLAQLDLVEPWRRRLARAFGDRARVDTLLARLANGAAIAFSDRGRERNVLRAQVEEALARTGLATIAGRNADEIADRTIEKTALAAPNPGAAKTVGRFLGIAGEPAKAVSDLRKLARADGLDLDKALATFVERLERFAAHGIDLGRVTFAADFGRRLDYYTGFVFEIHAKAGAAQIVGGGRYDRLLSLISGKGRSGGGPVPAVGFSIWLDRIGGRP